MQGWIEAASKYLAVGIAALVLFVFWRMLGRQRVEPVPVELLSEPSPESLRAAQGKTFLTPEALNELIQQKPANVSNALRDYLAVKKT